MVQIHCCASLPGYTYDCCFHERKHEVEFVRNQELYVLNESGLRGGVSGVHGPRHFESDGECKIEPVGANNVYGLTMTPPLLYAVFEFDETTSLRTILPTAYESEVSWFLCTRRFEMPRKLKPKKVFPFRQDFKKDVSYSENYTKINIQRFL